MKKSILFLTLCIGLAACGGSGSSGGADSAKTTKADPATAAAASKGEALMATADCNTCHRPDTKLVGPSFKEIATKYTSDDVDLLATKIIKGGSGKWGEVPMTPHPAISESEAKQMVQYILTKK